jgi:4-amino-4-deoxy-L-arabinose transferase-like glycosyltransferase
MATRRPARRLLDAGLILLVVAAVVAASAHAPSDLYAYAQVLQAGAAVNALSEGGSHWLLPRIQSGAVYHKPPLYPWLTAGTIALTGACGDFVFRLPIVLATAATALLVYVIAGSWADRLTALLAACLWATTLHMTRMAYLATTDMLLTLWITAAVLCVDRLLLHPGRHRGWWAVGLWAAMILAALSKGWGLVNLVLVGGFVALAAPLTLRLPSDRSVGWVRRVPRRWWRAVRGLRLGWGLLAMAAVLGPLWAAMFVVGGQEFREVVHFEVVQRLTGEGPHPPRSTTAPPALHLLYYTLPASVFAVGAVLLRRPRRSHLRRLRAGRWGRLAAGGRLWLRRCFTRGSPTALPLCWILAVLVPFSVPHGFRPDYLLPCYAAVAIAGAWAVGRLQRLGPLRGRFGSALRHAFATMPLVAALLVFALPWVYLLHHLLPAELAEEVPMPAAVAPETWLLAAGCGVVGAACVLLIVRSSLRWRLRRLTAVSVVAMVALIFLYTHFFSRHARTGDGEAMVWFVEHARPLVGDKPFAVYRVEKVAVEPLLGRFGQRVGCEWEPSLTEEEVRRLSRATVEEINGSSPPWLFVTDRGLLELGAARASDQGEFRVRLDGGKQRFDMRPEELGRTVLRSRPIVYQHWGRIYLIRLDRPATPGGDPVSTGYITGYPELDE